jgi:hypothetical protein
VVRSTFPPALSVVAGEKILSVCISDRRANLISKPSWASGVVEHHIRPGNGGLTWILNSILVGVDPHTIANLHRSIVADEFYVAH